MNKEIQELWIVLLKLKSFFENQGIQACEISTSSSQIVKRNDSKIVVRMEGAELIASLQDLSCDDCVGAEMDEKQAKLFHTYLACLLAPLKADAIGRSIVYVHCAQTLDAKLATHSNHSQWIGNTENLEHAHRMRALCDAILVGKETYHADKPQLTVRLVEGEDPKRFILSKIADQSSDSLLFSQTGYELIGNADGDLHSLLSALYQQGYNSLFVEGGACTISAFLEQRLVDNIQLHIAPMLMGSGKGFELPYVEKIDQCINFENGAFVPLGSEIMFIGKPDYSAVPNV